MARPEAQLSKGISITARAGYIAKGIVYLLIGGLTFMAALGLGGDGVDSREAISELITKPFGDLMLGALGVGLFAYAVWRLVQAFLDTEGVGLGVKGIATRGGFVISSLIHASLGVYCFDLLLNVALSSDNGSAQDRTATLMSHKGGIYAVYVIGAIFLGIGLRQMWRAIRRSYLKSWHCENMSDTQRRFAEAITRWGLSSRGLVFMIIGLFLCIAAWQVDPSQAQGLGGALAVLARQPFGPWLLGVVALGLMGYGVYCLINAWIRDTGME